MAQTPAPDAAATEARPTGLPPRVDWIFNFDATWGSFGFANSLFLNPKEGVDENLSDQRLEGSVKPALSGQCRFAGSSELHGKVSAVGEHTYGSAPDLVGSDFSSFQVEDLSIGWRSGKTLENMGDNAIDFTVGRTQYQLGHGLLLFDGAAEGGSRGGYWTNARKAFEFAAIGSFTPAATRLTVSTSTGTSFPRASRGHACGAATMSSASASTRRLARPISSSLQTPRSGPSATT